MWKAYRHISKFNKNFTHKTVNHTLYFKEPETGIHINGIESIWRQAKHKVKQMCGIKRGFIQPYLNEYMWRSNNFMDDPFYLLLDCINKF